MPLSQSEIQELREDFWTTLATSGAVLWWNLGTWPYSFRRRMGQ
jgi:hypothetical protein